MIMSGPGEDLFVDVPQEVRDTYAPWWWRYCLLLCLTYVVRLCALDIFGSLITVLIAYWCWLMLKNDCQQMSQYCVFSFGLMCGMQAVLELIPLMMNMNGRQHVTRTPQDAGKGSTAYVVKIEVTPFFDDSLGWYYNYQSWVMIWAVIVFVIGTILAKVTYDAYPQSMFEDDPGQPVFRDAPQRGNTYGAGNPYGGGQQGLPRGMNPPRGGGAAPNPGAQQGHQIFQGRGQRLGD